MEYKDLPIEYQKLCIFRRIQEDNESYKEAKKNVEEIDCLAGVFSWEKTPEKRDFWNQVHSAFSSSQLPEIPDFSRKDLDRGLPFKVYKSELLEEAKRKYPKGTVVNNQNLDIRTTGKDFTVINLRFNGKNIDATSEEGSWTVYDGRTWAKIISTPLTLKESHEKFKVGDIVVIVKRGLGCMSKEIGKLTKITEAGLYYSGGGITNTNRIGYRIADKYGNARTGQYRGIIGEDSFRLANHEETQRYYGSYPVTHSTAFFESDWKEIQRRRHDSFMADLEKEVRSGLHTKLGIPPVYFGTDKPKKTEPVEEHGIQPIVEAKVKIKKKSKRLIYKHY